MRGRSGSAATMRPPPPRGPRGARDAARAVGDREADEEPLVSGLGAREARVELAQPRFGQRAGEQQEPLAAPRLDEREHEEPIEAAAEPPRTSRRSACAYGSPASGAARRRAGPSPRAPRGSARAPPGRGASRGADQPGAIGGGRRRASARSRPPSSRSGRDRRASRRDPPSATGGQRIVVERGAASLRVKRASGTPPRAPPGSGRPSDRARSTDAPGGSAGGRPARNARRGGRVPSIPDLDDHLQRLLLRGVAEGVVGLHELVERELVGDELASAGAVPDCTVLSSIGVVFGVHEPGRDGDVLRSRASRACSATLLPCTPTFATCPPARDDVLADVEGRRDARPPRWRRPRPCRR